MEIDSDNTFLPRLYLEKSVVAAPPRQSGAADLSNNRAHDSDGGDHPILEYVIQLERSCDEALLAAALSSREIKIYARDSMELSGNLTGHKGALTQLAFSPKDCHGLFSASDDGTVRAWDTRSLGSTSKFGQSGEEIWSIGLGYDGHLCAAGKGQTIDFYDLRKTGKKLRTYEDCHTDAITQLRFHPVKHSFLLTASEDGLMCYFDTAVPLEEDALDSVLNAECAVRNAGFFGPEGECVYCCSNTETLSLWHAADAQRIVEYGDIRSLSRGQSLASSGEGKAEGPRGAWGFDVDYIVGCRYEGEGDKLWLVTGGFEGGACLATVSPGSITPEAMLSGGHSEQIRAFDWLGGSVATGGEDAKICLWGVPRSEGDDEMMEGSGLSKDDGSRRDGMEANGEGTAHLTSARRRAENRSGRMFRPYSSDDRRR